MKNHTLSIMCLFVFFCSMAVAQQATSPVLVTGKKTAAAAEKKINEADLKSKEISKEVSMPKNGEILIENTISNRIVVKIWDQPKVKITATILYDGDNKLTDEEWFEKKNLSLKVLGSSVKIKSGGMQSGSYYTSGTGTFNFPGQGAAYYDGSGQNIGTKSGGHNQLVITIPAGSKIDMETKYADISLPENIGDLKAEISNGNLEAGNLKSFTLRAKYSTVTVMDVKDANIETINGRFTARNVEELDIESKFSTVELALAQKATIRSANDEYEFDEVGEISGRKNYGNLRITRLMKSIEIEGANADIKIRNVSPMVSLIKLDDKYADIRIPVKVLKNYSVDFAGSFSSVYGNFEKKAVSLNDKENISAVTVAGYISDASGRPAVSGSGISTGSTVTGGAFSGTLSTAATNVGSGSVTMGSLSNLTPVTSLGKLTAITVSSDDKSVSSTTISTGGALTRPTITTAGTMANLTVSGQLTKPTYVSGQQLSVSMQPASINDTRGQLVAGTITGGTFVPNGHSVYYVNQNDTPSRFTANVGDGKGPKIELKCQSCTIDLK